MDNNNFSSVFGANNQKDLSPDPFFWSKNQIKKAGNALRKSKSKKYKSKEYQILENWRSCHADPMQSMFEYFKEKCDAAKKDAIIVQRLKRASSIIKKMQRDKTDLTRLEDIAGCRIILPKQEDVDEVYQLLKADTSCHELHRERDYIKKPKGSGYRGIHLIYKYNDIEKADTKKHQFFIELQIRTKIQHAWSTAVEVASLIEGNDFKASDGDKKWLEFFKLAGSCLASLENDVGLNQCNREEYENLKDLEKKLSIITRMEHFTGLLRHSTSEKGSQFTYAVLIFKQHRNASYTESILHGFENGEEANNTYFFEESSAEEGVDKNVVLICIDDVKKLKVAYPNYYADTNEFIKFLKQVFNSKDFL